MGAVTEYRVFKVTHATCGACGENQRVRIRLLGDVEIMPHCRSCGRTTWISRATRHAPTTLALPAPHHAIEAVHRTSQGRGESGRTGE